jgi:hypothetical protein
VIRKHGRLRIPGPSRSGSLSILLGKLCFRAQILTATECLSLSLGENDYESKGRAGSSPAERATQGQCYSSELLMRNGEARY